MKIGEQGSGKRLYIIPMHISNDIIYLLSKCIGTYPASGKREVIRGSSGNSGICHMELRGINKNIIGTESRKPALESDSATVVKIYGKCFKVLKII